MAAVGPSRWVSEQTSRGLYPGTRQAGYRIAMAKERIGKVAMMKLIGAALTNDRWGWDATRTDGSIVFIGWDYRATRSATDEVESCEIFKYDSPRSEKPGRKERARHIQQLLGSTEAGYLVIARPKDQNVHPHEIESFDGRLYTVRLEEADGHVHARVVASRSAPEVGEPDLDSDIQAILSSPDIPETEKPQLVLARRGQGLFRRRVELIERGCRLTGVADRAHQRASHIKPWRHSTVAERLDGHNGLLLAPHVDHLFDRGFISFADDGELKISPRLNRDVLGAWGILAERATGPFSAGQQAFLAFHRESVFLSE